MEKIYKLLNKRLVNGLVGLEIETEGENLGFPPIISPWKREDDGSLRGESAEYILKRPLSYVSTLKALEELDVILDNSKLEWSFRTSVHVHINILRLTEQQVKNLIYTYLLLEDVLTEYCGKQRRHNRFCLRVEEADGLITTLMKLFDTFRLPYRNDNRYAGLNIDAISKFGSLEFRSMRGTTDKQVLTTWIGSLVRLRSYAMKFKTHQEIFQQFLELPAEKFVQSVIGTAFTTEITKGITDLEYRLDRNASLTALLLG